MQLPRRMIDLSSPLDNETVLLLNLRALRQVNDPGPYEGSNEQEANRVNAERHHPGGIKILHRCWLAVTRDCRDKQTDCYA